MESSKFRTYPVVLLIAFALLTSCVPQKKLRYLQFDKAMEVADSASARAPVHRIAPYDMLHVQILSAGMDINKLPGFESSTNVGTEASLYIQSFPVDKDGMVRLPVIGDHHVSGLTIDELQKRLTLVAREVVSLDAEVFIRLVNFKVTLIGEVKFPGVMQVYNQRITILDALAMAGDMTIYGDRKKVMLIRENGNSREIHFVDLTDRNLLSSPYFYLQNSDIIYVQALDAKSYGFGQVQWGVILSSISTLIAILAVVYK